MNCKEVREKICDHIEHQLSREEAKEFEEHMKHCKECQEEYYNLEKVIVKLKNVKDIEPPSQLKYKILDKIKEEKNKKSKILYFKKYSYVAATLVIFLGGFYMLKAIENSPVKNSLYSENKIEEYSQEISESTTIDTNIASNEQAPENIIDKEENLNKNIDEASTDTTNIQSRSIEQQDNNNQVEKATEQTTNIENDNVPKVASEEPNLQNANIQPFSNSRSIQTGIGIEYLYEKTIDKENYITIFKHDIPLYKGQICSIYFENTSDENVIIYVEDIDGNKVSPDITVEKNLDNNMEFYMTDENLEQAVYTINVEGLNKNTITGYLKIEIIEG